MIYVKQETREILNKLTIGEILSGRSAAVSSDIQYLLYAVICGAIKERAEDFGMKADFTAARLIGDIEIVKSEVIREFIHPAFNQAKHDNDSV